jgi:RNase H-fold protein (predicted Holliday junction resolvase)
MTGSILGVDPGTHKAGYAVVGPDGSIIARGIEEPGRFVDLLRPVLGLHPIVAIALGTGTNSRPFKERLACLGVPIHLVDERGTSLRARPLYFADNPPRGWRRLVPLGMQVPPRPIDDYAAVLIARRFLGILPT